MLISPIRTKFNALNLQIRISEKQLGGDMRNINQKKFIDEEYEQYLPYIRRSGSDEEEVAKILGEIEGAGAKIFRLSGGHEASQAAADRLPAGGSGILQGIYGGDRGGRLHGIVDELYLPAEHLFPAFAC